MVRTPKSTQLQSPGTLAAMPAPSWGPGPPGFSGGMTEEETAAALGVTDRTVRRDWIKAKGFLHQALPAAPE